MAVLWVALSYNIPSDESKNRVYVWRKLRDMGAESFRPGVAILPQSEENLRRFRQLLRRIEGMGGSGALVELRFLEERTEREMVSQFDRQAQGGYSRAIAHGLELFQKDGPTTDRRELQRIERELRRARQNDYFGSGLTGELRRGLDLLLRTAGESLHDFGDTLRDILDD